LAGLLSPGQSYLLYLPSDLGYLVTFFWSKIGTNGPIRILDNPD